MHIGFALWSDHVGGAETVVHALVRRLGCAGHRASLLYLRTPEGRTSSGPRFTTASLPSGCRAVLGLSGLRHVLRQNEPDCFVLAHYDAALPLVRAAGYTRPIVVIEHGGVLLNPAMTSRRRYLTQRVVRRLWARDVAAEVCVSEYMAARQRALPHARRIRVIHNGVDLERFRPCERIARHSTLRVAAAGSLVPAKGFSVLVDAVGICRSRGREVVLHIAGQGPESDALARLACSWDMLGDQVLVGRVDDMAGFLVEHDLAVMPSLCEESFGMVAVEAQACGLPVVASRVGALAEVVNDDRSGLLVEPGNPEKLAAALLAYADDADMLRVHSSAAREWAEARFSLDVAAEAYERLFHEVIQAA